MEEELDVIRLNQSFTKFKRYDILYISNEGRLKKMKATICFTQYHTYEVEGEDEDDCLDKAEEMFDNEMKKPIARTWYDKVKIIETEEDD